MTNRKNQNSIIVLATLGVYLGLVLAGATPQVLAQAAMTRQFDVKDEIEFNEDLDNNPNGRLPADRIENYLYHVESFLDELKSLPHEDLVESLRSPFEIVQSATLPCNKGTRFGLVDGRNSVKNEHIWSYLVQLTNRLSNGYDLGDCLVRDKFGDRRATVTGLRLVLDENGFLIEVNLKKGSYHSAGLFRDSLALALGNMDLSDASDIRPQIVAQTSFRSQNDQVFIVTRLPRAGLDSLLAIDAK